MRVLMGVSFLCLLLASGCRTGTIPFKNPSEIPIAVPPDAKLLSEYANKWDNGTLFRSWVYYSEAEPPIAPYGSLADVYEVDPNDPQAVVSLEEVLESFDFMGVIIGHPRRAWICSWWVGDTHHNVVRRVQADRKYYTFVESEDFDPARIPRDDHVRDMPLILPKDAVLLLERRDPLEDEDPQREMYVFRRWYYMCQTQPPVKPDGVVAEIREMDDEFLKGSVRAFASSGIWIRNPREGWFCMWGSDSDPNKQGQYRVDLIKAENGFYLYVDWHQRGIAAPQGKATGSGTNRNGYPLKRGAVAARRDAEFSFKIPEVVTDKREVVSALNKGTRPDIISFFPRHIAIGRVMAASYFPGFLQGGGWLQIKFKSRRDALSDEEWASILKRAKIMTVADDDPYSSIPYDHLSRKDLDTPPTPFPPGEATHYILNESTKEEWNHGDSSGITILTDGTTILWAEWW